VKFVENASLPDNAEKYPFEYLHNASAPCGRFFTGTGGTTQMLGDPSERAHSKVLTTTKRRKILMKIASS
jgi:hypothetical protein